MKLVLLILIGAVCCSSCRRQTLSAGTVPVKIIGHGGCGVAGISQPLPFNAVESIFRAVEYYSADGIETDVQLSSDGVLFLFREPSLETESSCAGCIQQFSAAEIEQCRFRTFTATTEVYHIGRLETVMERFSSRKVHPLLFLDLHPELSCMTDSADKDNYYTRVADAIAVLVQRYQAGHWVMVQSAERSWLRKCRERGLRVLKDFTLEPVSDQSAEAAASAHMTGIATHNKYITQGQVAAARNYGLQVQLYGERSQSGIEDALSKSPDFLLTDNIPLLQNIVYGQ